MDLPRETTTFLTAPLGIFIEKIAKVIESIYSGPLALPLADIT